MDTRQMLVAIRKTDSAVVTAAIVSQTTVTQNHTVTDVHTVFSSDNKSIVTKLNPFGSLIGNKWDDVFNAWSKICDLDFHLRVFDSSREGDDTYLYFSNTSSNLKDINSLLLHLRAEKETLLRQSGYLKNKKCKTASIRVNFEGRLFGSSCMLDHSTTQDAISLLDSCINKVENLISGSDTKQLQSARNDVTENLFNDLPGNTRRYIKS